MVPDEPAHGNFTARETEILAAMAQGLGCRGIGQLLGISEFTVRKHRSNMLAKAGLGNLPQLIALARDRGLLASPPAPPLTRLTPRETAVLSLVLKGCTSKQIARCLAISDLTVRKHRENLMAKLGVNSTAALVALLPASAVAPAPSTTTSGVLTAPASGQRISR
ncbi:MULTISPECIES: response regulator transcription factor [unclassified Luteimonas]